MNRKFVFKTAKNLRLDDFLRLELPEKVVEELAYGGKNGRGSERGSSEISNSKIRRLIVSGGVEVNHKIVKRPSFELYSNSVVTVNFDSEKFFYEKQPDDIKFEVTPGSILFEDDDLIFINKPAFFPVEQTITGNRDNLHDAVVRYLWSKNPELRNSPYVGIMHRLDRETSGVILFTKNRKINKAVSEMFQSHDFQKKYLAIVTSGNGAKLFTGKRFTVEKYMGRINGKTQAAKWGSCPESKGGVYSKTDFAVLSEITVENQKCFLVSCNLYTGRTHQIRVHLSEAGCPIFGDTLYGGKSANRIYLHASELSANTQSSNTQNLSFNIKAPCEFL